jgi:YfiH family protein
VTSVNYLIPDWRAPEGVRAAFTLRTGGVSAAPFDALNVGTHVGDLPEAVAENRARIAQALELPNEPAWLEQVHGADVSHLDQAQHITRADAAVTHALERVCVIQVADCMPVLFTSRDGSAVGAAHAGWRGLASGVLEATVHVLAVEPTNLVAWMGPAIGPECFEVGGEVRDAFMASDPKAVEAFVPNDRGRWQCDLYALARLRLQAIGIGEISGGGWCTYTDASRFFSYRRDGQCGRMAALIWRED